MTPSATPERLPEPRLQMRGIGKRFGSTVALHQVDLTVQAGEVHALVGENGAGKSTLMKVLSGAVRPDTGTMRLDGQPYQPRDPLAARRSGVAMIYQELSLASHLTVAENLLLGLEPTRLGLVDWGTMRRRAAAALAPLQHPEIRPEAVVGDLSPAAQQLVEVGRALAVGCRVLVLDEPTSSLSSRDVERLFAVIARLRDEGHAIVYISHFLEEVKRLADHITVLRDGEVAGSAPAAELAPEQIVRLMVGRQLSDLYPRSPRQPGAPVLEVKGLAGAEGPQDASLTLHRGEVLGIFGLVGAGRTELLRALFGLQPVRAGEVCLHTPWEGSPEPDQTGSGSGSGEPSHGPSAAPASPVRLGIYAGPASPLRRWQQGVGFLSENRATEGLALNLSVADNVTLTRLPGLVSPARQQRRATQWAERLAIRCASVRQPVASLSGGNQQKVALARLLNHEVDVLLLDEPTRGIDVASKAQIYSLIDHLASGQAWEDDSRAGTRRAVLIVSSYLPELLGICDRVAVMTRGRLGPARPVSAVTAEALLLEATGQEVTA